MTSMDNLKESDKFQENILDIGFMITNINTCPITIL